jgi:ParB-like chromosome segregation protein Spo0J
VRPPQSFERFSGRYCAGRDHDKLCADAGDIISAVQPPPFNPTAIARPWGRPVTRFPGQLRLHRALDELGWTGVIDEFNEAARQPNQSLPEPILITTNGIILAGIGRWRAAVFDGRQELNCIEYSLGDDEALRFILTHYGIRRGWNPYVRIFLALTWELSFQEKARDNMRAGGKLKGSANLPKAEHIDVRHEIARAAGVGTRNVSHVKTILKAAHPRLREALRDGMLTINRAVQLCKLPRAEQLEQFIRYSEERATNKVIRRTMARPKEEKISPNVVTVLDTLQNEEARRPGSVAVRIGRQKRTVVVIGQDLFAGFYSQKEPKLI